MSAHFIQAAVLGDGAILADVEVIAHGAEAAGAVVALQLGDGVVAVAAGGGAVEDEEADAVRALHQLSVLVGGQELAFVGDDVAEGKRELIVYHRLVSGMVSWMVSWVVLWVVNGPQMNTDGTDDH